jgi:hypothetical protein
MGDKSISVKWSTDDVKSIRPDLSDEQCYMVLIHAKNKHNAEIGINWFVLKNIADDLYPIDTNKKTNKKTKYKVDVNQNCGGYIGHYIITCKNLKKINTTTIRADDVKIEFDDSIVDIKPDINKK